MKVASILPLLLAVIAVTAETNVTSARQDAQADTLIDPRSSCNVPGYNYDEDSINEFETDKFLGLHKREDTVTKCSRNIRWKSFALIHSFQKPLLYMAMAVDEDTGTTVVVKGFSSTEEARDAVVEAVFDRMRVLQLISAAPCRVPAYPSGLVNLNGLCAAGSTVGTCTVCDFACSVPGSRMVGNALLSCCGGDDRADGGFSGTIPTCIEGGASTTHATSTHGHVCTVKGYQSDQDSIWRFNVNAAIALDKKSGTVQRCERDMDWTAHGRIRTITEYVYDAMVTDRETERSVVFKSEATMSAARARAISAIFDDLAVAGLVTADPCQVPSYSYPLINIDGACPPGAVIDVCTDCQFACARPGTTLIGNPTFSCCGNITSPSKLPYCSDEPTHHTVTPTARAASTSGHPSPLASASSSTSAKQSTIRLQTSTSTSRLYDVTTAKHNVNASKSGVNNMIYLCIPVFLVLIVLIAVGRKWICKSQKVAFTLFENVGDITEEATALPVIKPDQDGYYVSYHVTPAVPTAAQLNVSEMYKMDSVEKGLAFILDNNDFSDRAMQEGSVVDAANVAHIFAEIGYEPVIEKNMTSEAIMQCLDRLKDRVTRKHNSIVLVFMAQGDHKVIRGVDGNPVSIKDIQDRFSVQNCPILKDKPKIFFFQTVLEESIVHGAVGGAALQDPGSCRCRAASDVVLELQPPQPALETDGFVIESEDMFIIHVVMQGYFSLREGVHGSWFIQTLCEEMLAKAHIDNLDRILTAVIRRVAHINTAHPPQITKQGISKQIFLLPKYPAARSLRPPLPPAQQGAGVWSQIGFDDSDDDELLLSV